MEEDNNFKAYCQVVALTEYFGILVHMNKSISPSEPSVWDVSPIPQPVYEWIEIDEL